MRNIMEEMNQASKPMMNALFGGSRSVEEPKEVVEETEKDED